MVPIFAVFYDPVAGAVTRKVTVDIHPTDSDSAIQSKLSSHKMPCEQMMIIPLHRRSELAAYLALLGIRATA